MIYQSKQKQQIMTTIKTLSTRSICDSDLVISVQLISMTEKTALVSDKGNLIRCKIYQSKFDDKKYIMPFGKYSMAPMFDL